MIFILNTMASVASVGQLAPLALAAGIAFAIANRPAEKPNTVEDTPVEETERLSKQAQEDMGAWGASASFWQSSHTRLQNMGAAQNLDLSLKPNQRAANLAHMNWEHSEVAKFDTYESMLAFDTRQGHLRMNKRNAIPSTLSEDLANPADPSRVARFDTWHELPNWANPAEIRQAQALLEADVDPDNQMRRHYGTELFNRAPGQSFRYGTTH